jgi:hypothetical protein
LIDHTLYVSSRLGGTRPVQTLNPTEFHELQWKSDSGHNGRLVEKRDVHFESKLDLSELSPPATIETFAGSGQSITPRHSWSSSSMLSKLVNRMSRLKKEPEMEQRRKSWLTGALKFDTASFFHAREPNLDSIPLPLPHGCPIPNAIFARKHRLLDIGASLAPCMPIQQMPTAESKATNSLIELARSEMLGTGPIWAFRGPFTPQLGFDGGLDYQWYCHDPSITFGSFDMESCQDDFEDEFTSPLPMHRMANKKLGDCGTERQSPSKRHGIVFETDRDIQFTSQYSTAAMNTYPRDDEPRVAERTGSSEGVSGPTTRPVPFTPTRPRVQSYELNSFELSARER